MTNDLMTNNMGKYGYISKNFITSSLFHFTSSIHGYG